MHYCCALDAYHRQDKILSLLQDGNTAIITTAISRATAPTCRQEHEQERRYSSYAPLSFQSSTASLHATPTSGWVGTGNTTVLDI